MDNSTSFPIQFCKGIRSHWRSRKYQKLSASSSTKPKQLVTRLGDKRSVKRRFRFRFRLRSVFKVRINAFNPIRILKRIRDAYINTMLGIAGKGSGLGGGPDLLTGRRIPKGRPVKMEAGEFERRLIMEIYNSVMASKEFAAIA